MLNIFDQGLGAAHSKPGQNMPFQLFCTKKSIDVTDGVEPKPKFEDGMEIILVSGC